MTQRLTVSKFIIYLVLIAFATGCTAMRPLAEPNVQSLESQVEAGDNIKIIRNDHTEVMFDVSAVSDKGISGDGVYVDYSDIWQVQIRRFSAGKTAGLVVAIVAVAAISVNSAESLVDSLFGWIWQ